MNRTLSIPHRASMSLDVDRALVWWSERPAGGAVFALDEWLNRPGYYAGTINGRDAADRELVHNLEVRAARGRSAAIAQWLGVLAGPTCLDPRGAR